MRIVIHRSTHASGFDRWFRYAEHEFAVTGGNASGGNAGWGYEVIDVTDGRHQQVQDGYMSLDDLRREAPDDIDAYLHPSTPRTGAP